MAAYKKRPGEFTLVELLVVITIISILAGLLLPVLKRAKDAAYQASCASNQRQIGIAVQLYQGDYHGWFPQNPLLSNAASKGNLWDAQLSNYLSFDRNSGPPVFHCAAGQIYPSLAGVSQHQRRGYFMNYYIYTHGVGGIYMGRSRLLPVASQVGLFCDMSFDGKWELGIDFGNTNRGWFFTPPSSGTDMGWRHNKGANVLFADSHVGWRLPSQPYPDGYPLNMVVFWKNGKAYIY